MLHLRDLSVRAKILLLIGVFAVGFTGFVGVVFGLLKPKLEDSEYRQVVLTKDFLSDLAPPPLLVIEPYSVLLRMAQETDQSRRLALEQRWQLLQQTFTEREHYWEDALPEGRLRDALARELAGSARAFFEIGDTEFLPAARAGDQERMHALLVGKLATAYEQRRGMVANIVSMANKTAQNYIAAAAQTIDSRRWALAIVGVLIIILGCAIGLIVANNISRRVTRSVGALQRLADGDFTHRVEDTARDELGHMSQALNTACESIRNALSEVQELSETLTDTAGKLSTAAETISSGAHEQAASLEETAASLEEITETVRQSSDNATQASQLAVGSRETAERGGGVVERAIAAMGEINDASTKIADIIATIDEIAFQTNILALNAAVEAARAGEQGKGFAVVAEQVGHLSQRSAGAAKEIKTLIQDSVRKVAGGTELVNRSGSSLQEIVTAVRRVTDIVGEMAAAFREQTTGLEQVNQAVGQMDTVTQSNSRQTEELSSTAGSLADHASHMRELIGAFRLGDGHGQRLRRPAGTRPKAREPRPRIRPGSAETSGAHAEFGREHHDGPTHARAPRLADRPHDPVDRSTEAMDAAMRADVQEPDPVGEES